MPAAVATGLMTTEEMLALPENGMERWLINGELREKPMTVRNRFHSFTMTIITGALLQWNYSRSGPRGQVLCGEAGARIRRNPDSTVGIDVAYFEPDVMSRQTDETTLVEGVPLLAVEILSPSDTQGEIKEKKTLYLKAGVALVWVVDPDDRTVTIYRPDAKPVVVSEDQDLVGDPVLPGFRVPMASLFE